MHQHFSKGRTYQFSGFRDTVTEYPLSSGSYLHGVICAERPDDERGIVCLCVCLCVCLSTDGVERKSNCATPVLSYPVSLFAIVELPK